jgi:hypothetical protein
MKQFTTADVVREQYIYADRAELVEDRPAWMQRGLQQTATGYGARLNSGLKIHYNGRLYRLYVTIYSNNGTVWFVAKGRKIIVS